MMSFTKFYAKVKAEGYAKRQRKFWQTQYSLYVAGCRDVRMHDFTLVNLSMTV